VNKESFIEKMKALYTPHDYIAEERENGITFVTGSLYYEYQFLDANHYEQAINEPCIYYELIESKDTENRKFAVIFPYLEENYELTFAFDPAGCSLELHRLTEIGQTSMIASNDMVVHQNSHLSTLVRNIIYTTFSGDKKMRLRYVLGDGVAYSGALRGLLKQSS
jgi:hypothetical protein